MSVGVEPRVIERPRAVRAATWLLMALIGLGAVTVVLTIVRSDDLVLHWAMGHQEAREIVQRQGLDYLKREQPIAVANNPSRAATPFMGMPEGRTVGIVR